MGIVSSTVHLVPKGNELMTDPKTLATPVSRNKKIAGRRPIAATYRTKDTCSSDCPFVVLDDNGMMTDKRTCYAATGPGGGAFALVNRLGRGVDPELEKIYHQSPPGAVVRHLVSGDLDVHYIRAANSLHSMRPDLEGYGYTHHWRILNPSVIKGWVVNASCETTGDVKQALEEGWQCVIESPTDDSLHGQRIEGRRVVTCPAQRDDRVKCSDCTLCRTDSKTRPIVEFLLHGGHQKRNHDMLVDMRAMEANLQTKGSDHD